MDHQSFLGDTIKDITMTKVRSCDNTLIVTQQPYEEVYDILDENFKNINILKVKNKTVGALENYKDKLPLFLQSNLKTVLYVLEYLQIDKKDFILPKLNGRYEKISQNITLDVGHNPWLQK